MVSVKEKAGPRPCQVSVREMNVSEPLLTRRKRRDDVKTGRVSLARDKSGGYLFTVQTASGVEKA